MLYNMYFIVFFGWFKEDHHHLLNPLPPRDPRFFQFAGALEIRGTNKDDEGNYRYEMVLQLPIPLCTFQHTIIYFNMICRVLRYTI